MKFTVERKALVKMLQCVGKKHPTQTRRDKQVRLSACAARVFVAANQTTAGTEALVFEDGTCFLQQTIFLKVLKTYTTKPNITIEAGGGTLKFFSTTLPVTDYSPAVTPPGKFKTFSPIDIRALLGEAPPPTRTSPPPQSPSRQAPDSASPMSESRSALYLQADGSQPSISAVSAPGGTSPFWLPRPAKAAVASARMPRSISQTDAGRPGESWESHRTCMG